MKSSVRNDNLIVSPAEVGLPVGDASPSAANIAARLGDYGKVIGHEIVATAEVALEAGLPSMPLGPVELHNVAAHAVTVLAG